MKYLALGLLAGLASLEKHYLFIYPRLMSSLEINVTPNGRL